MPRPFNPKAERNQFALPEHTRAQIAALILDLDMDARDVVILAVAQLWQRELGEPERDVCAELDALKAEITRLKQQGE